jgi:hypothetical protein
MGARRSELRLRFSAHLAMDSETITYMILVAAGALTLGAFGFLILVPAWGAYGRLWERVAASVLTLFVLAAFGGAGIFVGLVIVYYWDSIIGVFGTLDALGRIAHAALTGG